MKEIKDEVKETYDSIAPFFSRNRTSLWPPTASFLDSASPCSLLDIGCGTGRVMIYALQKGCSITGLDISNAQIEMADTNIRASGYSKGFELQRGDMEDLPFEDSTFDNSVMIASLHHLPTRDSRIQSLKEASRVLKPGGMIQISVWTWDQERFRARHLSRIEGRREPDEMDGPETGDLYVPWKDGKVMNRFYHLYGPGELEGEIAGTGLEVVRSFFDGRNHRVEARKK